MPYVALVELPAVCGELAAMVGATGFNPNLVVYVERGARLPAWEICGYLGCNALGVSTARTGSGLKRILAPAAARLPKEVRNWLRKAEERLLWGRGCGHPRVVKSDYAQSLNGLHVLVVDDAADSGRTIEGCRAWLLARGVESANIRSAVLAATTPAGRSHADFWIFDRNTRFPWSSDSPERRQADELWHTRRPPLYSSGKSFPIK